jgi:hypothetical protein
MEMQQTHCYATELLRYYGNAIKVHRSCHQGNPTCNNIILRKTFYIEVSQLENVESFEQRVMKYEHICACATRRLSGMHYYHHRQHFQVVVIEQRKLHSGRGDFAKF